MMQQPGGMAPQPMGMDQQQPPQQQPYAPQQWMMMPPQHQPPVQPQQPPQFWPQQQQPHYGVATANAAAGQGGAGAEEVRSLWIGDLQYWMDENYLTSCFYHTGEVNS